MQSWLPSDRLASKRSERARLYALQELTLRLNRSFDQRTIMEQSAEWVAGIGLAAAIVHMQRGDAAFRLGAASGLAQQTIDALRAASLAPDDGSLAGYVVRHQCAVLIEDAVGEERFPELRGLARNETFRAVLALPLLAGERCMAVLMIFTAATSDLDAVTTGLLELLASQIALALDNASTVADLRLREAQLRERHSQLRRAYDLVAAERRTLASVLDCAGDAVLVTDAAGVVLLGNQAVEQVLGLHPDLLIGQPLRVPAVPQRLIALIQQAQARGDHHEGEFELPDGRVFHVNIAPVQAFDQPIHAYVSLFKDVTYFKRLDTLKSQFVATVSHDMKSPLNVIHSYTEMLELSGPLNDEQSEYVGRITASVRRLTDLVSDLLDLTRLEAHVGLRMAPCDITIILKTTADDFRLMADEKRIDLEVRTPRGLPAIWGDESRLRQVVSNLLSNALTYTPCDGMIWLSAAASDQGVTVKIEDSGIGIAPYDVPHIFDPFYRAGPAQDTNTKGTGLGLAIVKRIVEEHGGAIGVESAINGGSTFWFTLPIVQG